MPLLDRPRSAWILGAAIETIVWSMKVIATAKIIAVRIRLFDRPPAAGLPLTLMVFSPLWRDVASTGGVSADEVGDHRAEPFARVLLEEVAGPGDHRVLHARRARDRAGQDR